MSIRSDSTSAEVDPSVSSGDSCPGCGGRIVQEQNDTVCNECGIIYDDQPLDRGPQVKFNDDGTKQKRRSGPPLTVNRHDKGISSEIGWNNSNSSREFTSSQRLRVAKLHKYHNRAKFDSKSERNLAHGFSEIRRLANALGVPDPVKTQACQIFKSAQSEELLIGKSIEGVAAASLLGASRCNETPHQQSEIAGIARVSEQRVLRAYNALNQGLGLPTPPPKARTYIAKVASAVDCPAEVQRTARQYAKDWDNSSNVGNPAAVAAACLYNASKKTSRFNPTQEHLSAAAETNCNTLRSHSREVTRLQETEPDN